MAFGPLSGASMNRPRPLGPMIASGQHSAWIYIVGSALGALIAVGITQLL
ncbi:MAG: hypothetical protein DLM50_02760 [Candidatus Meridianibacter frigidus]|nr:MAG: hypothetical protein DLM50_02760 [Candidatus Eremiobacteraeota bacterium]